MKTTYKTTVLGFGNHAAIEIPDENLKDLGGSKRSPLKITVNNYTYQSTATVMQGKCMVVFPTRDREASSAKAGDEIEITLELDSGYRNVYVPTALQQSLDDSGLTKVFHDLPYSKRKEYARLISEAKSDDTINRRLEKIIRDLIVVN